jgi:hypothetical protein
MLLHSGSDLKTSPLTRGVKLGRIQLVAKDPLFDPTREPNGVVNGSAVPTAQDGTLPDPAWSKDIRDYYNAVMQEPIPQEFLDLLARIAPENPE